MYTQKLIPIQFFSDIHKNNIF